MGISGDLFNQLVRDANDGKDIPLQSYNLTQAQYDRLSGLMGAAAAGGGGGGGHQAAQNIAMGSGGGGGFNTSSSQARAAPRSAASMINQMYDARERAAREALRAAYDQNVIELNAAAARIPVEYQTARNQASAHGEIMRANFNEFAARRGLNVGAGSQAHLAKSNALLGNLSDITRAEADTRANLALQRARLSAAYRNDVARAISDGEFARARALYNDFVRMDNQIVSLARR